MKTWQAAGVGVCVGVFAVLSLGESQMLSGSVTVQGVQSPLALTPGQSALVQGPSGKWYFVNNGTDVVELSGITMNAMHFRLMQKQTDAAWSGVC